MYTFIFDTREKKNGHIKKYFDERGIKYKIQKLDEGDYQIEGQPDTTVDRKQNLDEMYNCLINDKSRFMREVRRCYKKQITLYLLIEHGNVINSVSDGSKWQSKYGYISGREIMERLNRLSAFYGVIIIFCTKEETPQKIIDILIKG